jgi:hypothetical protein
VSWHVLPANNDKFEVFCNFKIMKMRQNETHKAFLINLYACLQHTAI